LCSNGSEPGLGLTKELGAVPAGRYRFSAWVRRRPQNPGPAEAVGRIEAAAPDGERIVVTPTIAVRNEWDRLAAAIDLDRGADSLRLTIGTAVAEPSKCLFVDDVMLTRE
jgi:hypothetical protein